MAGQDWFEKDFYAALEVPVDADQAAIKKAYRRLARAHHPDATGGNEARFKEIGEAYSVLSDAEQRQQYDTIRTMTHGGPRFAPGGSGASAGFEDLLGGLFSGGASGGARARRAQFRTGNIDMEELLRGMGGGGFGGGFPGHGGPAGPQRGSDVAATTSLVFRDAVQGATVTLQLPNGRPVTVRIPSGVRDGQRIRLRGKGNPGDPGAAAGDLLVTVTVEPDPVFSRQGDDLVVTVPVSFAEVALGATIDVPLLAPQGGPSTVRVKVPAGTPSGRTLRVRGRGVKHGKTTGDLRVVVQVVVPQRLVGAARDAVEAYAAATATANPRAELMEAASRASKDWLWNGASGSAGKRDDPSF
ncbi:MAG: DnaJ C-terminal domain-containing protein [Actinomycetota bacterium]